MVPRSDEFEVKVKGQGHQRQEVAFFALSAACMQFMFGKTSLVSSCLRITYSFYYMYLSGSGYLHIVELTGPHAARYHADSLSFNLEFSVYTHTQTLDRCYYYAVTYAFSMNSLCCSAAASLPPTATII